MGIRSWFGLDKPEAPEPVRPGPPTTEELLGALDAVERQARDGKVPGVVLSRLLRVTRIVRETVPRLASLGLGSEQGYSVMATATDYLPVAIGNYLRLPRDWADSRPIADGKSSVMLLVDQLDLLGGVMDKVYDAVCRADAEAIVVHGAFLEQKFGHASSGGSLGLDTPDPTPRGMPGPTPDPLPSLGTSPTPSPTPAVPPTAPSSATGATTGLLPDAVPDVAPVPHGGATGATHPHPLTAPTDPGPLAPPE